MSTTLLRDRTLPHLISSKAGTGASGVVRATRGKLKRIFCLDKGWLVFAASNLIEEQLEEYLIRNGSLSPADRATATTAAAGAKRDVLSHLLLSGVVSDEVARSAMEGLVRTLLTSCLEWPDGEYQYAAGRPDLSGKVTVRLDAVRQMIEHARRFPRSLDAVRIRLGPPDIRLSRSSGGDKMLESLPGDSAMRFLLEHSDGSRTLGELLGDCPASEEETLRSLYGLMLAGALDEGSAKRRHHASAESPLTAEECIAILGRIDGADHYGVLGLDHGATRDQIREAYYSLARRYHPDRFRAGDLVGFLSQMEGYFTKVTEAYNTLHSPDLRREYDDSIAPSAREATQDKGTAHLARQNFLRAKELLERRRLAEAASYLENAIKQDDSVAEYHLELGALLAGNPRRRPDAEEHLMRAAEIDPSLTAAYLALGELYVKAARPAEAARLFRETLRWDPHNVNARAQIDALGETGEASEGLLRRLFGS